MAPKLHQLQLHAKLLGAYSDTYLISHLTFLKIIRYSDTQSNLLSNVALIQILNVVIVKGRNSTLEATHKSSHLSKSLQLFQ